MNFGQSVQPGPANARRNPITWEDDLATFVHSSTAEIDCVDGYTTTVRECATRVGVTTPDSPEGPAADQPSSSLPLASRLLTKRDLAAFLGVTPRTIELHQRRGLPFYRLGPRRNRYDLAAVRRWLNQQCRVRRA